MIKKYWWVGLLFIVGCALVSAQVAKIILWSNYGWVVLNPAKLQVVSKSDTLQAGSSDSITIKSGTKSWTLKGSGFRGVSKASGDTLGFSYYYNTPRYISVGGWAETYGGGDWRVSTPTEYARLPFVPQGGDPIDVYAGTSFVLDGDSIVAFFRGSIGGSPTNCSVKVEFSNLPSAASRDTAIGIGPHVWYRIAVPWNWVPGAARGVGMSVSFWAKGSGTGLVGIGESWIVYLVRNSSP